MRFLAFLSAAALVTVGNGDVKLNGNGRVMKWSRSRDKNELSAVLFIIYSFIIYEIIC